MRGGIDERPIRRLRRLLPLALGALPMLLSGIGCASLGGGGRPLVPTRHQVRTGSFLLFSNTAMTDSSPAVRCLQALERDLERHLAVPPPAGDEPVAIYVLDDREAFAHFLRFYYPELPPRRAFFLARGSERVVYTYASPRLEEDLRHEATHALLRGAFGDLPLWLDEGLAEYFESDLARPAAARSRLDQLTADLREGWTPHLERLEGLTDIHQMTPRDYREAWAWVDLLLNGPAPGRSVLMGYLGDSGRAADKDKARLSSRLTPVGITTARLLAHLQAPRPGAVATQPAREPPGSVRLQDRPLALEPPTVAAPPRGLFRRLRAWLGL